MIVEELAAKFGLEVDEAAFSKVEAAIHGLHHGLMGLVGAFGAAVVTIGAIVESVGEAGDHAARSAEKIGMTTQALQGLTYAAHLADVSAESLESGLKFLSKNAVDAAHGSKEMQEEFARAGITLHDSHGKMKELPQLLSELADKFHKMPKGVEKTDLAIKLLGRSGIEMVPLLNKGSKEIGELTKRAEELGLIMSKETVKDAEEYADGIKEVGAALTGLKNAIGGPLLKDAAKVTKFLSDWIVRNRTLIATPIVKFAKALAAVIGFLAGKTKEASLVWFAFATFLATRGVQALTAMKLGFDSLSIAAIRSAVSSGAAWLAAIAPFVALAALIVLITDDLYTFATGGNSVLGEIVDLVNTGIDPNDNAMLNAFKLIGRAIFDLTGPDALANLTAGLALMQDSFGNFAVNIFKGLAKTIAEAFASMFQKTIVEALNNVISLIPAPLRNSIGDWFHPLPGVPNSASAQANMGAGGGIHGVVGALVDGSRPTVQSSEGQRFAGGGRNAAGAYAGRFAAGAVTVNVDARGNNDHEALGEIIRHRVEEAQRRHLAEARAALEGT